MMCLGIQLITIRSLRVLCSSSAWMSQRNFKYVLRYFSLCESGAQMNQTLRRPWPLYFSLQVQPANDSFLALTTDGINFLLSDQEICDIIKQCHDPTEAADVIAQQVDTKKKTWSKQTKVHCYKPCGRKAVICWFGPSQRGVMFPWLIIFI